jgi:D-alanyl-D-alanine carboxypeptidase/D-alanyl-D-alanine-endopeptidase (penicillin-binding protein 4)
MKSKPILSNIYICFLTLVFYACTPHAKQSLYAQKPSWYSYVVGDINSSVITNEHNKDVYVTPASCQKVVTSLVALKALGKDYRFKTQAYLAGKNNQDLVISFSGDPSLTTNDLIALLAPLKGQAIKGSIIVNISKFQTKPYSDYLMIDDIGTKYSPPVSAWVLDHNWIMLTAQVLETQADSKKNVSVHNDAGYVVDNQVLLNAENEEKITAAWKGNLIKVSGSISPESLVQETRISPEDLHTYILNKMGIVMKGLNLTGRVVILNDPTKVPEVKKLVAAHLSEPLEQTLPIALGKSDNLFFDVLYLAIINDKANRDVTDWVDGNDVMKGLVKIYYGVDMGKAIILDGSGLSRYNQMQPSKLYTLLVKGYENKKFVEVMPGPGTAETTLLDRNLPQNIKAKTGTMMGISCLCGYKIDAKSPKAFVVVAQGYSHPRKEMAVVLDGFVTRVLGN